MAFIEISHVSKVFGKRPLKALQAFEAGTSRERLLAESGHILALHDVTLSIPKGEIFVVMGLSGSGKSTLIRHINRLIDPTVGSIVIDGVDILKLSIPELIRFRRKRLAMVFQHFALLPHRTVLENVAYGLELNGMTKSRRNAKAEEWIAAVGLAGYEGQYPSRLSGGMQQRVGLARALCVDHDIILMDEAFSALDPLIRSQMQDLLMSLQERLKKTIVFITHDLDEALRLGDTITILRDGVVIQVGRPAEILLRPADDYVRAFVRDVNRGRALTAEDVMEPAPLVLRDESPDEALAEMERRGAALGYVMAGSSCMVLTADALRAAMAGGPTRRSVAEIATQTRSVARQSTLDEALPAALASEHPIPVLDADGALAGVLSSARLAEILVPNGRPATLAAGDDTPKGIP